MKDLIKNLVLVSVFVLGFYTEAYAVKDCVLGCGDKVTDTQVVERKALQCPTGHRIDQECLTLQVRSHEQVKRLQTQGLSCCGTGCGHKFPLDEVKARLAPAEQVALQLRIDRAASPVDEAKTREEVTRLKLGITEAFNRCCPVDGCGATFGMIEGCNAAKCENGDCGATFCYLCSEIQENNQAAHAHAREHSGNYWEHRPGYTDRYHWLLARKQLSGIFKGKVEESTRNQTLDEIQALLKEKKMWPLPAGLAMAAWLAQVKSNTELSPEAKIELLQNEAIYRRQVKDKKNGDLVETEIRRLGGLVLASLDVRDAAGMGGPVDGAGVAAPRVAQVAAVAQAAPAPRVGAAAHLGGAHAIAPVLEDHPRHNQLSPAFRALGNMYEVAGLIWSGVAPRAINQRDAVAYCASLGGGARLPTKDEYVALSRAMGSRQPEYWDNLGNQRAGYDVAGYNRNLIPDMNHQWFWSASFHPRSEDNAFYFDGFNGEVFIDSRDSLRSVRCVVGGL